VVQVELYNLVEELILSTVLIVEDGTLNTVMSLPEHLANGMYVMNLQFGKERFNKRLIVER
jgi:hypothetical protein